MHSEITLGKVFGVEIGIHPSWLLTALMVTTTLAAQLRNENPQWETLRVGGLAMMAACLFFARLIIHELAHALVAKARGIEVHKIILFALGGVSILEEEPSCAGDEFWVAMVGPFTSFLLSFLSAWTGASLSIDESVVGIALVFEWLALANGGIAIFNLIPAYPMDGGRVLRSILWKVTGDLARSTRNATRISQGAALLLIAWGVLLCSAGNALSGLWIIFLGWYLFQSAQASLQAFIMRPRINQELDNGRVSLERLLR